MYIVYTRYIVELDRGAQLVRSLESKVRSLLLKFETAGSHGSGPTAPNGLPRPNASLVHLVKLSSVDFVGCHVPAEACWSQRPSNSTPEFGELQTSARDSPGIAHPCPIPQYSDPDTYIYGV